MERLTWKAATVKHWCGLGVLVLGSVIGCTSVPKQESWPSNLSERMMDYYKAPDWTVVEAVLAELDDPKISTDPGVRAPILGFLATIFVANPDRLSAILGREYGKSGQGIVALSLHYSGAARRAAEYLGRNGWEQQAIDDLSRYPTALEDVVITNSYNLDIVWGAFFASGDLEYIAKILAVAESPWGLGVSARDVLEITFSSIEVQRGDPSGAGARRLKERYSVLKSEVGEEGANQVLLASTALRAVGSNAKQHPLILDYLKQRIARSRDTASALPLQWAVFQQAYPNRAVAVDGESVLVIMLTVRSKEAAKALLRDWSVENLEVGGTQELKRGTPPVVLLIIQNKLRCDGEYHLVVTEPGGATREYPSSKLDRPDAESSFYYNVTTLTQDDFQVAGSYEYDLRITACGDDLPPISNGFFVY